MTIVRRGGSLLLRHAASGERLEPPVVAEAGWGWETAGATIRVWPSDTPW
jgi:hypothetical protein